MNYLHLSKKLRLCLNGAIKIVRTAPWPHHYPNKSDCQNSLYDKSTSFMCDGRFLADCTNGRAYATVLRLSSVCL